MFKPEFFEKNRAKLREKFEDGTLFVFTANGLQQRSGSTTYLFRQDSNFWYLSGIEQPDILLVMQGGEEYLILPKRSDVFKKFHGRISNDELSQISGIKHVYDYEQGSSKLKKSVLKSPKLVTCLPLDGYVEAAGFYSNPSRRRLSGLIKTISAKADLVDARTQLAVLRMTKEKEEIKAIENAVSITVSAFEKIKPNLNQYRTESELMSAITAEFLRGGAAGHAYDPIVASGRNACVLHYLPRDYHLHPDGLVLIDAGAEFMNYASDITRTYALSEPTQRQLEVYKSVMDIRNFALGILKPGTAFKEFEKKVKEHAEKAINELNLKGSFSDYYPHAVSHSLGLDVHDAADYDAVLQPNMVITVEPGIYIEEEGIGIRIEDDILITKDGYRNLSKALSRDLT